MAFRVVSLPATTRRMKNDPNSCAVSRSPSTSAAIIADVMSSVGFRSAALPECLGVGEHRERRVQELVVGAWRTPGRRRRGWCSSTRRSASCRSAGMPIIEQMISSGNGPAKHFTKSAVRSGWSAIIRSTSSEAWIFTWSSTAAMCFGVKPFDTIERSRKCFGSSIEIIDPKNSLSSWFRSPMLTPPRPEQNSSGFRLACQTSSWRVTAKYAGPRIEWRIDERAFGIERETVAGAELGERARAAGRARSSRTPSPRCRATRRVVRRRRT